MYKVSYISKHSLPPIIYTDEKIQKLKMIQSKMFSKILFYH